MKAFIESLKDIVGERWVLEEPWQLVGYERDYWPLQVALEAYKGIRPSKPAAAVLPGSEEEVVSILDESERHGVRLIPYAGGTGVLGGATSPRPWVVIDLARLDWVRWADAIGGVVDVGSGALLATVEDWLNRQGWSLRHIPQSYPAAIIGGLVSTRSIGQYSTGYGGVEARIKGLRVAVPGVGLVDVKPAPRRSLLYPIEDLFTGSEGLLGIITGVYMEALRLPECSRPLSWILPSFSDALAVSRIIVQGRIAPELFRVYDELESNIHFGVDGSLVIGVVEGDCGIVDARVRALTSMLGEPTGRYAEEWLRERFNVISAIKEAFNTGYAVETIEVSASWGRVLSLYRRIIDVSSRVDGVISIGAHASHFYSSGSSLYFTFLIELGKLEKAYWRLWTSVMEATGLEGGSIGHHHGVGRVRGRWLHLDYGKGVDVMKRIKECIDPKGVLREWPG